MDKLIIAIDGPASSGKSTTAKLLAEKLGYLYIDTGAMYRAITLMALRNNIVNNQEEIIKLARNLDIELKFENGQISVFVDGVDVSEDIRSLEVSNNVSPISKIEEVRKILVEKQRLMGKNGGVVMEGRDITTVVFPNADVKIFLTATIDERAKRRVKEYHSKGIDIDFEKVVENIKERDRIDSSREVSPLKKSDDAIEIDTSYLTIDQQVNAILEKVNEVLSKRINNKAGS
ncbi:MAG: (d)CMP kinase [Ignavibacterium sp.]|nr:(d)CMP kinase [Ignavibacterium sp.]MDW8375202.1 (d)CMP kinase [Ignavibacteriales bacterium]